MRLNSSHIVNLLSEQSHLLSIAGVGIWQSEEDLIASLGLNVSEVFLLVASDAPGQAQVLLLHGHALGMNGTQICVLEQADHVGLRGLLESLERLRLKS